MRRERIGEAEGPDPRGFDGLLHGHAEFDHIEKHLEHRLALNIPSGGAPGHEELAILEGQARGWGQAWPLAGHDRTGMARLEAALHAARGNEEPQARHHRGIVHRIRRRTGIDIALGIDHAHMDGVGRRGDGPLCGVQALGQRAWSPSNDAGCRHAAGSTLGTDPGTLGCRIRGAEQCPGRHVNKARIADIGFAVRKRQIQRFCERVEVGRRVMSQRLEVDAFQDLQRLQQDNPLAPGVARVHGVVPILAGRCWTRSAPRNLPDRLRS